MDPMQRADWPWEGEGMAGVKSDVFVLAQATGCLVVSFIEMGKTHFGFAWSFVSGIGLQQFCLGFAEFAVTRNHWNLGVETEDHL